MLMMKTHALIIWVYIYIYCAYQGTRWVMCCCCCCCILNNWQDRSRGYRSVSLFYFFDSLLSSLLKLFWYSTVQYPFTHCYIIDSEWVWDWFWTLFIISPYVFELVPFLLISLCSQCHNTLLWWRFYTKHVVAKTSRAS